MKWIGQHIWSLISRFRNDVYLEDVSTGTIASGGNLGLDSNNKIVKANEATGDITGVTLAGDSGSASDTSANVDLTIAGGNAITTSGSSTTITINHDDTSSQASVDNSGSTYIQDVTLDTYGHVTGLTSAAIPTLNQDTTGSAATLTTARNIAGVSFDGSADISLNNNAITNGAGYTTNTGDITGVTAGTNLSGGGSSGSVTINLADASTSAKGAASFDAEDFSVSSGAVTIKEEGVDLTTQVTGVLPSANLDADTVHYSATRQCTYNYFKVDLSSKVYVGLQEADAEHSSETNKNLPILAPVSGKLLKVFVRTGGNVSAKTLTITLEHLTTSNNTATANVSVVGTQSGAGPTSSSMVTYDFTSSLDSGTNVVSAGDMLFLGFASSASTGNILFYVTSLWEWDYS